MSLLNRVLRGMLVGICTLMSVGCSYEYILNVEGIALHAADQSPVTRGVVILKHYGRELRRCEIGQDGKWLVQGRFYNASYRTDANGTRWLDESDITLHLEMDERVVELPCPRAVSGKSSSNFYAFVIALIDTDVPESTARE